MIGQTTLSRGKSWITSYALGCASRLSTPGLLMLQRWYLLHGFPQQPSDLRSRCGRLNAEGLRTLTPTQRGYTAAARPSRRRDYRTAATAADVIALLDTAGLAKLTSLVMTGAAPRPGVRLGWYPDGSPR